MTPASWVPVLHASEQWFAAWHVGDPSVVLKDGRYYMVYRRHVETVFSPRPGYPADMVQCLMAAVSDGRYSLAERTVSGTDLRRRRAGPVAPARPHR